MGIPCEHCKRADVQTFTVPVNSGASTVYLCSDCYKLLLSSQSSKNQNESPAQSGAPIQIGKENQYPSVSYTSTSSGWTGLLKIINIVSAIVITIAGFVIGANVADAISYNDGDVILGSFIGGVIGLVVGLISVALSMVIAEISDTLKSILAELRKK